MKLFQVTVVLLLLLCTAHLVLGNQDGGSIELEVGDDVSGGANLASVVSGLGVKMNSTRQHRKPRILFLTGYPDLWASTRMALFAAVDAGFRVAVTVTDELPDEVDVPGVRVYRDADVAKLNLIPVMKRVFDDFSPDLIVPIDQAGVFGLESYSKYQLAYQNLYERNGTKHPNLNQGFLQMVSAKSWTVCNQKHFLKQLATKHDIPTADYVRVTSVEEAQAFLVKHKEHGIIFKPDDLCGGTGVIPCKDEQCVKETSELYRQHGESDLHPTLLERYYEGTKKMSLVFTSLHGIISCYDLWISDVDARQFGSVAIARLVENERVLKLVQQVVAEWNYTGIGQIQFLVLEDGFPLMMEFNPRIGIVMPYRLAAGIGHNCLARLAEQVLAADGGDGGSDVVEPEGWPKEMIGDCIPLMPLAAIALNREKHVKDRHLLFGPPEVRCNYTRVHCHSSIMFGKPIAGHRKMWLETEEGDYEPDSLEARFWNAFQEHGCHITPMLPSSESVRGLDECQQSPPGAGCVGAWVAEESSAPGGQNEWLDDRLEEWRQYEEGAGAL